MAFTLLLMTNTASLGAYYPSNHRQLQECSNVKWDLYHKKLPKQDTVGVCIFLIISDEGRENASEKRA